MRERDIHIGRFYNIKVGKHITVVRIMQEAADGKGGWDAVTVAGDKDIIIRSAGRIVGEYVSKVNSEIIEEKSHRNPKRQTPAPQQGKHLSALDAAAKVLAEAKEPLNCKMMIDAMTAKGYWQPSQGGRTPANTLHAAIGTEIKKKGDAARFEKVGRGQFGLRTQ